MPVKSNQSQTWLQELAEIAPCFLSCLFHCSMKTHHELIFLVVDTRVLGCVAVGRLVARLGAASFCNYTIIYTSDSLADPPMYDTSRYISLHT